MPEGVKRKISAIMSADVVGYSRLMEDDEQRTVQTMDGLVPENGNISSRATQRHSEEDDRTYGDRKTGDLGTVFKVNGSNLVAESK